MTEKIEDDIAKFFLGRDDALNLFNCLRNLIESKRSPKIEVSKRQISFGEVYKYIWVWLPQTWIKNRPENSVTLTIVTGKKIHSNRITESVQPKKGFWTHHIIIESGKEIDKEIDTLIQESIDFYLERLEHKRIKKMQRKGPAKQ